MSTGYDAIAFAYDRLNAQVDYEGLTDFYEKCFRTYAVRPIREVLDLGCGTGSVTLRLAERGYDMTGVDKSAEMLAVAAERARRAGRGDILFLEQDMTDFELFGTVGAAVSSLDCVNHLTRTDELKRCLSLVHLYLEPGGLFIFDVNTPYRFLTEYAGKDYVLEDGGVVCCWRNDWHPSAKTCDFLLTLFEEQRDGTWTRTDGMEKERSYSRRHLERLLRDTGFEVLGVFDSADLREPPEDCLRWQFVGRAVKN